MKDFVLKKGIFSHAQCYLAQELKNETDCNCNVFNYLSLTLGIEKFLSKLGVSSWGSTGRQHG